MEEGNRSIALMIESDGPGGAESVVLTLANGFRSSGYSVHPLVFGGGPGWLSGRLREHGFEVFQPRLRRALDPAAALEIAEWLKRERISVVHSHEFATSIYGGLASRLVGIPHVMTMHGGVGYSRKLRRRIALSAIARFAKAAVGVSRETAQQLANALWLDQARVRVIPNGIEVKRGSRATGRQAFQVAEDVCAILAVGNLYHVKGHDVLIRAAALLRQEQGLPAFRIFVAGRGELHDELLKLCHELGVEELVVLMGLRSDISDLLAAADVFVMPSRSEGLPMALLEAMFAQVPVVCSSVGGMPAVLCDGKLGSLVPPEDPAALAEALRRHLADREAAKAIASIALRHVEHQFSAATMVGSYTKVFFE